MKLNEITDNKTEEIIQWFIDSGVQLDGITIDRNLINANKKDLGVHNNSIRLEFLKAINLMVGDVLDFSRLNLEIRNFQNKPMPFKLGKCGDLVIDIFDVNAIKQIDFSHVDAIRYVTLLLHEVGDIDLNAIMPSIEKLIQHGAIGKGVKLNCENTGHRVLNLIPTCASLMNITKNNDTVIIGVGRDKITHRSRLRVLIDAGGLAVSISGGVSGNKEIEFGKPIDIEFDNAMDLQEWLIDNGFEQFV